jgi:voltage-gated potassium channel Kch
LTYTSVAPAIGERPIRSVLTFSLDLYFSFTTLTTTGYGNLVPTTNPGQSLAVPEMLIGQLFLVTAVAKVVTIWRPGRDREHLPPTTTAPEPNPAGPPPT